MKSIIAAAALTLFCAAGALAHDKVVVLEAKNGNVTFEHAKHKGVKGDCKACHESEAGGKIAGMGKDWAHKTCIGCHKEMAKGPQKCGECHKK
ncbi:cytochrome c7 [Geobacter sp.]|uniref:cytochrome c7 n=1 Tax=Geobacter sp. TaxID=46610 RepID=UPI0027BACD83|nr:cytochrome c7 [Geobacter sp.]